MPALDLSRLQVRPLATRRSLSRVDDTLIPRGAPLPPAPAEVVAAAAEAAERIREARSRGAAVILMYGAHLLRNGAALLVTDLLEAGWVTHLATNGAGGIHDWEYAWLGQSTENVQDNVAAGSFGAWAETGGNHCLALATGALHGLGYGSSLGRFILEDGCLLPPQDALERLVAQFPGDPLAAAAADLLALMNRGGLAPGWRAVEHHWKHASIIAQARRLGVEATIHPGIGYDIVACHPWFAGSVYGRAAGEDFRIFAGAVEQLDHGVVLAVGSAVMAPQVFEKSLSCVHNLRAQAGRPNVSGHTIYVIDLQDGGHWDWSQGEPPKTNPAYYLRFCKSFSRMGGAMRYVQSDNTLFVQHLCRRLLPL